MLCPLATACAALKEVSVSLQGVMRAGTQNGIWDHLSCFNVGKSLSKIIFIGGYFPRLIDLISKMPENCENCRKVGKSHFTFDNFSIYSQNSCLNYFNI